VSRVCGWQAVANGISEYQRRFGGVSLTGCPWEVMPDAPREAAPEELFQKQVHRADLQARGRTRANAGTNWCSAVLAASRGASCMVTAHSLAVLTLIAFVPACVARLMYDGVSLHRKATAY
jgi:hypothetical protein